MQQTSEYEQFTSLKGNRVINQAKVKNLMKSIGQYNMLMFHPIIVNKTNQVIDGQHRLEAAKRLHVPIYYVVDPTAGVNAMVLGNANQWSWGLKDYAHFFTERGDKNYQILVNFAATYKISLSISMYLLSGIRTHQNGATGEPTGQLIQDFKLGNFKVADLNRAQKFANFLNVINPYCEKGVITDRNFISALQKAYARSISQKYFLKKLQQSKQKFPRRQTIRDYIFAIMDIYNFRTHEANKINLY